MALEDPKQRSYRVGPYIVGVTAQCYKIVDEERHLVYECHSDQSADLFTQAQRAAQWLRNAGLTNDSPKEIK